jgi:SAM-dependent methyltransferase
MGEGGGRIVSADPSAAGSIQRAIDSLDRGGVVYVRAGTYHVERTILLRSGVQLVGDGPRSTNIVLVAGANCHMLSNENHDEGNEAIRLSGFSLEGNMRGQERPADATGITFACGAYFKTADDVSIADVVAHGIRQSAFHFSDCTNVDVHHAETDELGWSGVSTSRADNIVLRNLVITNSGLDVRHSGIHLDGGTSAYVEVVVDKCVGNGIMLGSEYSPLRDVVVRSSARRSLRGISLTGTPGGEMRNIQIIGGRYTDNRECGLNVANASTVQVIGGEYSRNRETGITILKSSDVFIVDATIDANTDAGIVVYGRPPSRNCVVAGCDITGGSADIVERGHNQVVRLDDAALAAVVDAQHPVPITRRVRKRLSRIKPRRQPATPVAPQVEAVAAPVDKGDSFDGTCNVCGLDQRFTRGSETAREGYRCSNCDASLRYRGQADALIRCYAQRGSRSIAELVNEPDFARLAVWEPGVLGPFRMYLEWLPNYVMSDFWPDVRPGDTRDGVRCEDLMNLTLPFDSFDLVITSDIFEHVRKPYAGFAEVHRVLRPGGRHIFSIPVQDPMAPNTVERVDTSGDDDVFILEPRYHLGPKRSQHLVYTDFGLDLVDRLADVGFDTDIIRFASPSADASRLLTFCSVKTEPAAEMSVAR